MLFLYRNEKDFMVSRMEASQESVHMFTLHLLIQMSLNQHPEEWERANYLKAHFV